ncbi:hypothetical protein Q8W71_07760 [Methylobacterium sp. NEAU 140]|uniref:hypothetical protein n=1 Tax=Methylobacterium sp. NEAU 140 TaxID=3064945 RepID=UPI002734AF14|nr:hypothetical protein [Methylobacterium sp. NEAU 140]MDP4022514.1 hypothetical protein [Methylobacterium sp. NEAU 140]
MRLIPLALTTLIVALLGACSSTDGTGRSGLSETFSLDNYRVGNSTDGTQTRRDVNRAYTQPSLPTIGNRGM